MGTGKTWDLFGFWVSQYFLPTVALPDFLMSIVLRRMPIEGGASTVLAYLYGGQGTINVPSWSPDGKYVAFVSNSGKY